MEKKFGVSASTEVDSLEKAEELVRTLARLGLEPHLKEINTPSSLLPIEPERLPELGSVNFREFTELMQEIGRDEQRAVSVWGVLLRHTDLVQEHDSPLYEVDDTTIMAKARPESRASRKHFENHVRWARHIAYTSLDLAPMIEAIQDGSLHKILNIGPIGFDDLTMIANLRIENLLNQDARVD